MGDADIIPIGTGGRPGRGSGHRRPSSAARDLAGARQRPRAEAARDDSQPVATEASDPATTGAAAAAGSGEKRRTPPAAADTEAPQVATPRPLDGADPRKGIPIADWLDAEQAAYLEKG